MGNLSKSRLGRAFIHLLSILYCINNFCNPHIVWHLEGILRELKKI